MTPEQTQMLLARVAGFDSRAENPVQVTGWAKVLKDVPYDLCVQAVEDHFASSTDYLQVAHVVAGARRIHKERQRDAGRSAQQRNDRSDEIRRAALERKAADLGTRVATPEEAERYGKGALDTVMAAVLAAPRTAPGGPVAKGAGVRAGLAALEKYRQVYGSAPLVDRRRQPCGNALCTCTHDEPCEAGYIPVDPGDPAAAVTPCPTCKGRANAIVTNAGGDRRAAAQLLREQAKPDSGPAPAAGSRDNAW
jgi:hypothetical protein